MSLRDTISGAMEEVAGGDSLFARSASDEPKAEAAVTDDAAAGSASGFTKRSTARAKPRREAAGSVRVMSSEEYRESKDREESKNLSRSERRAKKEREQSSDDRRNAVARYILQGHAEYQRSQRIWWTLIIIGIIVTLLTWGVGPLLPKEMNDIRAVISVIMLIIAYVCVIGSFIYDWRVVRPMRKAAEEEVARMSDKRVRAYLNDRAAAAREAAERGEKPSLWKRLTGQA